MTSPRTMPADTAISRLLPRFGEFVTMMAALMALTALSIDVMLPALPAMREAFGVLDPNLQQLVITSYLVGFSVGQLFYGPLSDWLGRKPVLFGGLAVYALASFGCLISQSFDMLLLARFIQGVACASPRVIAIAVVRDAYGGRRMAEVMSFVMMVFVVVPVLAPTIGDAFLLAGNWQLIFAFLCVFGVGVLGWSALRLPETHPAERRETMTVRWVVEAYRQSITTLQTCGYALAASAILGSLMAYIHSAQQIFVVTYGAVTWFPVLFGCVALTTALAAFVNSRLVGRLGMRRVSHVAIVGFLVAALLHLGIDLAFGEPPLAVFVLFMAVGLFCFGLAMPNFNSIAMDPMGRIAGTASSFFGALTTGVGAALGLMVGQAYDGSVTPLLIGFVVCGFASLVAILFTEKGRLFGTAQPVPE